MKDNLANRMLVNVVGIPALLWILWSGGLLFNVFILLVEILALWEFYRLCRQADFGNPLTIPALVVAPFLAMVFLFPTAIDLPAFLAGLISGFLFFFLAEMFRNVPHPTRNLGVTVLGLIYLPLGMGSYLWLRNWDAVHQEQVTMGVFITIWICDSFAYLFGKQWGTRKILPRVSPNKSWVGTIAGVGGAFLTLAVMKTTQFFGGEITWRDIIILTLITGVFGQLGDFAESLIKRDAGVKDSGSLLKGHGGVLDRFDSLLFAGPLVFAYFVIFNVGT